MPTTTNPISPLPPSASPRLCATFSPAPRPAEIAIHHPTECILFTNTLFHPTTSIPVPTTPPIPRRPSISQNEAKCQSVSHRAPARIEPRTSQLCASPNRKAVADHDVHCDRAVSAHLLQSPITPLRQDDKQTQPNPPSFRPSPANASCNPLIPPHPTARYNSTSMPAADPDRFLRHGPIRVSADRTHLAHADPDDGQPWWPVRYVDELDVERFQAFFLSSIVD